MNKKSLAQQVFFYNCLVQRVRLPSYMLKTDSIGQLVILETKPMAGDSRNQTVHKKSW
jgi:hypothetical protein